MRIRFLFTLLIVLIAVGGYWFTSTAAVCPAPILYRLGQFYDEFNLSKEEAVAHLAEAEALWEEEAGRELFIYDENASFAVNFIFDERQEFADTELSQSQSLDAKREKNEEVFDIVDKLQAEYRDLKKTYEARVVSYESRLQTYNETVQRYNDQGGAPADEYQELQREQRELDTEVSGLSNMAGELNALAQQINELGQRGTEIVEEYNREVAQFNRKYGYSREFTQGDYQGEDINIYKFSSDRELVGVLTHEFGHSLGIDHVEGEGSIMYYLLADTSESVMLSVEDRQALFETCGNGDETSHVLRRYIRGIIGLFN